MSNLTEEQRYKIFIKELTDKVKLADELSKENAELKHELAEKERIMSFWKDRAKELQMELDKFKR